MVRTHKLVPVSIRRRKHWGWGFEDQQPALAEVRQTAAGLASHLAPVLGDVALGEVETPVPLSRSSWLRRALRRRRGWWIYVRVDVHARACHALGKSYSDVICGFRGQFAHPPDLVAYPRDETDVERLLEWCASERIAAIPYGGGTSVVGGVTPMSTVTARPARLPATARSRSI